MKISWNWLSEYVDLKRFKRPEDLAQFLTDRGLEVEAFHNQAKGFDKVISAKILEMEPHPNADRLRFCQVSRKAGERLGIVCGAKNMKVGDVVALAQVGAVLPNGLEIKKSKIRDVESNGMLCSESELGLSEESDGILILPEGTPIGKPVAKLLGRNDIVFELGITPNRGDCLSHIGIAREVASLGGKIKYPKVAQLKYRNSPITLKTCGEDGPQFYGCAIEGVKIGPSPEWLKQRVEAMGNRSINNVVDATNFVVFELGHPVHAYDLDRLSGKTLSIRKAKKDEKLPLLDDTEVSLTGKELVISDGPRSVGLAGVMGGGNSDVQDSTTRLYLECAEFSPKLVRLAAGTHQKHTDASHRFERGIDPDGLDRVISRLAHVILEVAGGKVTGSMKVQSPLRKKFKPRKVDLYFPGVQEFLGIPDLTPKKAKSLLEGLDCKVKPKGSSKWSVTVPSHRNDVSLPEDLAEEIARSFGYDKIVSTVPKLSSRPVTLDSEDQILRQDIQERAKDLLVQAGLFETIQFSFSNTAWLKQFGLVSQVPVSNPLSEEQEVMIPSLLPGLVQIAKNNWSHHFGAEKPAVRLFEIRPTFHLHEEANQVLASDKRTTGVHEHWRLGLALGGNRFAQSLKDDQVQVDFYDLKGVIDYVFKILGTKKARWIPLSKLEKDAKHLQIASEWSQLPESFHPGQGSALVFGKVFAGVIGRVHPKYDRKLKLKDPLWMGELDWDLIAQNSNTLHEPPQFSAWSEFPNIDRDFALIVGNEVESDQIVRTAIRSGQPLAEKSMIFDVYQGDSLPDGKKSVGVRVTFSDKTRSLKDDEVEALSQKIISKWQSDLGATLRQ